MYNVTNNRKSSATLYYKLSGTTNQELSFSPYQTQTINNLYHVDHIMSNRTILHLTAATASIKFRSVDTSKEITSQTDGFFEVTDA